MPTPEEIYAGSRVVATEQSTPYGIPVTFRKHGIIDPSMKGVDKAVRDLMPRYQIDGDGYIWSTDAPELGTHLFDTNPVLEETLAQMGLSEKPECIEFSHLQSGRYASHLLYRVKAGSSSYPFVAYVSRFPDDHSLGGVAEFDYRNLREMHKRFEAVPSHISQKYAVVEPYSFGSAEFNGRKYSVFTTQLVTDHELHASVEPVVQHDSGKRESMPLFRYAIELTPQMEEEIDKQNNLIYGLQREFQKNHEEGIIKKVEDLQCPERQTLYEQQMAVVRAAAVYYIGSGGRFPDLEINSGDLMTTIQDNQFQKFTLITARHGLKSLSRLEWIDEMLAQRAEDHETGELHPVFNLLNRRDYIKILDQTVQMFGW